MRPYIKGTRFTVRTGHDELRRLMNLTESSGRLARWRLLLAEFDFSIRHQPGRVQATTDALFRLATSVRPSQPSTQDDLPAFHDPLLCVSSLAGLPGFFPPIHQAILLCSSPLALKNAVSTFSRLPDPPSPSPPAPPTLNELDENTRNDADDLDSFDTELAAKTSFPVHLALDTLFFSLTLDDLLFAQRVDDFLPHRSLSQSTVKEDAFLKTRMAFSSDGSQTTHSSSRLSFRSLYDYGCSRCFTT